MSTLTPSLRLESTHLEHPASTRGGASASGRPEPSLPRISPLLLRWFQWYSRGYIRRHFHAVRMGGRIPALGGRPLVGFVNHASWWDAMLLFLLGEQVAPGRRAYAPIDAEALERYAMFKRMGLFGVEQNTARGAVQFLKTSRALLSAPHTALWLTPQGRFSDVRERPVKFDRGLGALARRSRDTCFLPVAMEYCFWGERLPEVLIWIGDPLQLRDGREGTSDAWSRLLEERLAETQDTLARACMERDPTQFQTVLQGGSGVGRFYDFWRSTKARLRGESFSKEHGNQ